MKIISFGKSKISTNGPCYVIAEIGHNHQGNLETALRMVKVAASYGVQAVKFQKRDNKTLYTIAMYNKPYDNENSYGATYGEHREFLEFGRDEYLELMKCAEENGVEFMSTAFDFKSADFLADLGITSYKMASADVTNTPLLEYIAKLGKPMFISTGAATMEEIRIAYETVIKHNDKICLMHCIAGYPTEYHNLNLKVIETLKREFPDVIIGYSGHDNGILAAVISYMLGATVLEKHFTLNRSWKGTDHRFSLEPEGLRKQIRDLRRIDIALGESSKTVYDFEIEAKKKMGKGIYASRPLSAGSIITWDDICLKTPTNGTPPYMVNKILGKKLKINLDEEASISLDQVE
ncbi:MAG: N-acetylneuraminate synthase family protein [Nitrospirae bacterium]|nr:N-acetylneuraminate synthase family protein [Nitrospirota bacterium]